MPVGHMDSEGILVFNFLCQTFSHDLGGNLILSLSVLKEFSAFEFLCCTVLFDLGNLILFYSLSFHMIWKKFSVLRILCLLFLHA